MVTTPASSRSGARASRTRSLQSLAARKACRHAAPPLGIMVEVPAAAIAVDHFDAAFLLDRLERPHPIRHGRSARHRGGRRTTPTAQPGGLRLIAHVAAHGAHGRSGGQPVRRCRRPIRAPSPHLLARAAALVGGTGAAIAADSQGRRCARHRSSWASNVGRLPMGAHEGPIVTANDSSRLEPVAAYKSILQAVLDTRPSGTRQRLAARSARTAASSRRSPIPPIRCRSRRSMSRRSSRSAISRRAERDAFLVAYRRAHPGRLADRRTRSGRMRAHVRRRCRISAIAAEERAARRDAAEIGGALARSDRGP